MASRNNARSAARILSSYARVVWIIILSKPRGIFRATSLRGKHQNKAAANGKLVAALWRIYKKKHNNEHRFAFGMALLAPHPSRIILSRARAVISRLVSK